MEGTGVSGAAEVVILPLREQEEKENTSTKKTQTALSKLSGTPRTRLLDRICVKYVTYSRLPLVDDALVSPTAPTFHKEVTRKICRSWSSRQPELRTNRFSEE